ncbi:hypothetical protein ACIQJT_30900 [Streptomyces sp. NPDC091972]|uniref:hypothetical protein n=1 Tax=Streptomyces sp. NPDC091972 TaxID=3366007 RepID=UPI0038309EE4
MTGTSGSRTGHVGGPILDDEPALHDVPSVAEAARRPCPADDPPGTPDGRGALRTSRCRALHAVVLDGMPPEPGGHRVPRRPRFGTPGLPVLTLDELVPRVCGPPRRAGSGRGRTDGSVRVLSDLRRKNDGAGTPVIHTVRALGHAITATGEGR